MISVAKGEGDIGEKTHFRRAIAPPKGSNGSGLRDAERQDLVRAYLPLVRSIARRYAGRGEEFDDLVQAGSVGLVKASARFDPSRGVAFGTFATPAVEGAIRRHLSACKRGVALAPEPEGTSADPVTADAGGEAGAATGERGSLVDSEFRVLLAGGLRVLDERERRIVFLRFHADMTERQIARSVGLSQAHVSRLLDGALTKLRAEFSSTDAEDGADTTRSEAISPPRTAEIADERRKIVSVGADQEGVGTQPGEVAQDGGSRSQKSGYSGRFLVRMPGELHEQLALAAERKEVSLNRLVNETLSSSVGLDPPDGASPPAASPDGDGVPADPAGRRSTLRVALAANVVLVVIAGAAAVVLMVLALQRGI
ncbi:MAG TPA: sigma-70 family RNA polymerase sigma factor [Solirubrobacteraceae bacterium]|nr:sigma-70 family RNA polymerase sigma factor [Solirubrobacteraceae bacterium]